MADTQNNSTPEEIEHRRHWFDWYVDSLDKRSVLLGPAEGVSYHCPCCGHYTLNERGGYDICPVCFWEDDGQDEQDADTVRGGPNGALSLTQAKVNYKSFGACDERSVKHVRLPLPEEQRGSR